MPIARLYGVHFGILLETAQQSSHLVSVNASSSNRPALMVESEQTFEIELRLPSNTYRDCMYLCRRTEEISGSKMGQLRVINHQPWGYSAVFEGISLRKRKTDKSLIKRGRWMPSPKAANLTYKLHKWDPFDS